MSKSIEKMENKQSSAVLKNSVKPDTSSAKRVVKKKVTKKATGSKAAMPEKSKPVKKTSVKKSSVKKAVKKKTAVKKTASSKSKLSKRKSSDIIVNREQLSDLTALVAYHKAHMRGLTPGSEKDDWLKAEREVLAILAR